MPRLYAELEGLGWDYIIGCRLRTSKEVNRQVLSRAGRYKEVSPKPSRDSDPSPLKVKEVWVGERRYVVCLNEDRATKDRADREAILESLREKLKSGDKQLVGNKGYRRFLCGHTDDKFQIDDAAVRADARYDGKWVLRTNTDLSAAEVALKYKQLWLVEDTHRSTKSLLATRPIFHRMDETIRGHVFCSFLALLLRWTLQNRLDLAGQDVEWGRLLRDLDALTETDIEREGRRFRLRSAARGSCSAVFQAMRMAFPPTIESCQVV